ncbi:Thioredoxin-like domain-containing protein [Dyadobacter koreensis]|uniref:Thioredoxin-like domain-containing protein n=1 Tax=Dyadobacter koreensis TaxID=408657 RepID=A0A1H6ZT47_9BACT|nr:thioredoxin family protein [Dyadobacter koreensis]SEJ56428.1 Thioredoxin-like domain-containing protein [Dyadobacter koreensis]
MISLVFVFLINILLPVQSVKVKKTAPVSADIKLSAKNKFIVFSGSDWCKGCIQFRKKVLNDPSFETFAKENLEVVVADFPQRAKLAKEIIEQNEALAEKYNPKGVFPNLVLISDDGAHFEIITYKNQTPQEFVNELKNRLQHLNG